MNEEAIARAESVLRGMVEATGLNASVEVSHAGDEEVCIDIVGEESYLFVGPQGQALDALQFLLLLLTNRQRESRLRITVDANGYRKKRSEVLTTFAHALADQVASTGQEAITDALNALERRIVHTALIDHPLVKTYSEGDDPDRFVVISPREEA